MRRALIRAAAAAIVVITLGLPAMAQTAEPDDEVVLRVGTTSDLTTDNVWGINAGSDWVVATTQYDMLLKFSSEDASPAPSLAEGCEPSDDFMTYTCTLREGLTWSDGEPLTSRDIAFTYRFSMDHNVPVYRAYFPFDPTFETPDDRTLIWRSEQPTFAPLMPPWVYIVPEHVWSRYDDADLRTIRQVDTVPAVGSGPFTLTEWERGQFFIMERNPNYWGEEPAVDRIEYRIYSNQEGMILGLQNGEIDFADGLEVSLFESLAGR